MGGRFRRPHFSENDESEHWRRRCRVESARPTLRLSVIPPSLPSTEKKPNTTTNPGLGYILTPTSPAWLLAPSSPEDIRVECAGQWTRGMCVVDRRLRRKAIDGEEILGDTDGWLNPRKGNRVRRMAGSPGEEVFAHYLLERIFGS